MFKVGEKRKPQKVLPALAKIQLLRAENIDIGNAEESEALLKFKGYYASLKFKAHDAQKTPIVSLQDDDGVKFLMWTGSNVSNFELDVPSYDYDADATVELWGTDRLTRDDEEDEDLALMMEEDDVLIGTTRFPVGWIVNGFGGGYSVSAEEPGYFRFVLEGSKPRTYPFEIEVKVTFVVEGEHTQRSTLRWTSLNFEGKYQLDADKSDNSEDLQIALRVPFVLRRLEDSSGDTFMDIKMAAGGNAINFATSNLFYKEPTGQLKIDELFQNVKTYRGASLEKRLYWDWSSMPRIVKGEPYPTGVLVAVTRASAEAQQVIEAWDMSRDRSTLTQLSMVGDKKFRRVWSRLPEDKPEPLKHPKVAVRKGSLVVAIIDARDLAPEEQVPVTAFAALKVITFNNKDLRYAEPLDEEEAKEETTQAFPNQKSPVWNQIFSFPINADESTHQVLNLQVWNRENDDEEVLIGSIRVPVPWAFNGFGSDLGPAAISAYQATFKLKRGDTLDPTAKVKYGGGRVTLKLSYQPDFN